MTDLFRVVFDTNIFVSAFLSNNPTSPAKELLQRWENGEFKLVVCEALVSETARKLLEKRVARERVFGLTTMMAALGESVHISPNRPRLIPGDQDDDAIIACAVAAEADYLVTYDKHFDVLGGEYQGVKIVEPLAFLWMVRGDWPPEK